MPAEGRDAEPVFACAGVWRMSDEWGPVYSMIMTEANEVVAPVHNRMPMVLGEGEWNASLGEAGEAGALSAIAAERLSVERTGDAWIRQKEKASMQD